MNDYRDVELNMYVSDADQAVFMRELVESALSEILGASVPHS